MSNKLILLTIFGIVGFGLFLMFIYLHEAAHQTIFSFYGINSTISMNIMKGDANTIANVSSGQCDNNTCALAQNINDVVGYHLEGLFFLIFAGFVFMIIRGGA